MSQDQFNSPHLVSELRPQGTNGAGGKFYELTPSSVSPVRHVGRDDLGRPIEDTIPTVHWKPFVMLDGCVNKVPMRTCSEFKMDPESVQYEQQMTKDLIGAGCMPLWVCPYTFEFSFITKGPLAKIPEGSEDCGGDPRGCSHMKKIMEDRKAHALVRHKAEQARVEQMKFDEIEKLRDGISDGVGRAIAQHMGQPNAKKRLTDHRSDGE